MRSVPVPPALEPLLERAPSETTPFLLALARRQAARRTPADLLAQHARDAFVAPAALDQRTLHRLDGLALDAAAEFEALQLSPVAPLGACSAVAPTSQDRTLAAARGTEVVSDPTNVLALECARRLRADPKRDVRLCTVHQVLRAQRLPPIPGASRHFRLFTLADAGPGRPEDGFEVEAVARHLAVFDRLCDAVAALACTVPRRRITIFARPDRAPMAARIRAAVAAALPHLEIREEPFEKPYYDGIRVMLFADTAAGRPANLADTGVFDWVARLAAHRKLRFVASGCGVQLLPLLFRPEGAAIARG